MKIPRRDLSMLLPMLAATQLKGQNKLVPSSFLVHEELQVKTTGQNKSRAYLDGTTHTGFPVEVHETQLAPGQMPHPAHHHPEEEMLMIREGMMEVTINGKVRRMGPGSVAYVASGEEHGWKNVGDTVASYFVVALGPKGTR